MKRPVSGFCPWVLSCALCAVHSAAAVQVTLEVDSVESSGVHAYSSATSASGVPYWSDQDVPHTGADYVVPAGKRLGALADDGTFAGDSLTVEGTFWWYGGWGSTFNPGKPLEILPGGRFYSSSYHYTLKGDDWTISGTEGNPSNFQFANNTSGKNADIYLGQAFKSDGVAVFFAGSDASCTNAVRARLDGADFSDFSGTMRFRNGVNVYSASLAMPGTLDVEANILLDLSATSGESSFGELALRGGARLNLAQNNTHVIKVSKKLLVEEGALVCPRKFQNWTEGEPPVYPVFELAAEAVSASGDLEAMMAGVEVLSDGINGYYGLPRLKWVIADGAAGGKTIGLSYVPVVSQKDGFGYGNDAFVQNKGEETSTAHWSDGKYPHAGCDYLTARGLNALVYLTGNADPYVFRGERLVVPSSFGLYSNAKDFSADFVFCAGGNFRAMSPGTTYHLRGTIKAVHYLYSVSQKKYDDLGEDSPTYNYNVGDASTLCLDASISGGGLLGFGMSSESTPANRSVTFGRVELNGDNVGFTGKMSVSCWQADTIPASWKTFFADDPFVPGPNSNITLRVVSPTGLGGAREAFAFDSLCLGNACRLEIAESATFAEPTRGWYFPATAYLKVQEGKKAVVKQTLTFGDGARLTKEGLGVLALGGEVCVDAGAVIRPVLQVAEGALGFASATALDGISVGFAPGTALVVDAKTPDEALRATGLVVDDATFRATGTIPVRFDVGDDFGKDDSATVALMTAADAALAESLMGRLSVGRVKGHRVTVSLVTNADSSVSLVGTIEPSGLMIFVR